MKKVFYLIIFVAIFSFSFSKDKMSVVFINPGKSDETFWVMVSNFMKASAEDLDVNLEIIYGERNYLNDIKIADKVLNRAKKPDYLVVVNEKLVAETIINKANKNGVKTLVILNELTEEQKNRVGKPRKKNLNYIGSLVPNNIDAGYLIAKSLANEADKLGMSKNIIAINGNRATPASVDRGKGLIKFASENKKMNIMQTVYAEWEEDTAYTMVKGLLKKYDNVNIIWAANDPMAIGSIAAAKEIGKIPGKNILIGGLNWSKDALNLINKGTMVSSVGGHFMVGAWALVVLYDYNNGKDFLTTEGATEINTDIFGIIDKSNIKKFSKIFDTEDWSQINFKAFSKKENPTLKKYDFSIENLLRQF